MKTELARQPAIYHRGPLAGYQFRAFTRAGCAYEWQLEIRCGNKWEYREVQPEELVEYANCQDAIEAVQRYLSKFGPPCLPKSEKEHVIFSEPMGIWKSSRLHFCMVWDRMMGIDVKNEFTERFGKDFPNLWKAQPALKAVQATGEFRLTDRGPIFVAETHYMALIAKLLMVASTGKLRKCLNPECAVTPYFIAEHGKAQYCCEECGKCGQRQAKLKYWRENKQGHRKQSKSASARTRSNSPDPNKRRRKNGTRKAR